MNDQEAKFFFVFDVESIGLHGEGFAVGWVVVNREGQELDYGECCCDPDTAKGLPADRRWVTEHVPPITPDVESPFGVREVFWTQWLRWKKKGALMAAEVPWPVEARFLNACVDIETSARTWEGPYPLIDIASVRFAVGLDPLETVERLEGEGEPHVALDDARQSARLLVEALRQKPYPTEGRDE